MRKFAFFLSLMVVLSLVLAACGGSKSNNQGTQTVPTAGVTELPNTGLTGTETTGGLTTTETTGLTGTETTGGLTATETPMVQETSTPSASTTLAPLTTQTTGGLVTGTQTAALPPTGMADPSRLTTLMTFDVRNANGDVLGDVNNMIIDLGAQRILYVLVGSGGFLGIGEKQIPIPYEQLQVNPACIAAISGTSSTGGTSSTTGTTSSTTGSSTGMSSSGTVTSTEMAGTGTSGTGTTSTATSTETAGTTGTGASTQAGSDNCYFLLNVDQNVLKNAPNFDRSQLPDINTPGWDGQFNQYWQQNGTGATSGSSVTGSSTSSTGSATATETPSASTSGTGSSTGATGANAQANNRLILADELLGNQVVAGNASSSTGTSTSSSNTGGTGSATTTETAVSGTSGTGSATSTETAGAGSSSTGSTGGSTAAAGETLGTIMDAIVELQTGVIRYYLVTADAAMGSTLNGRLVPIPPQAFTFPAAGSSSNQRTAMLNVNNMTLSQAPAFDEGTFPNASIQGWDTGLRNFWSSQNLNSMMNP